MCGVEFSENQSTCLIYIKVSTFREIKNKYQATIWNIRNLEELKLVCIKFDWLDYESQLGIKKFH